MRISSRNLLSRVLVPLFLVCAIATSLWFAVPVKALEILFPSPPTNGTVGTLRSFTTRVSIADPELLPIQSISLHIYKSDARAVYEATCANLPLDTTVTAYTSIAPTGSSGTCGTVSITALAENWGYGYGYGYVDWQGSPYYFFPPGGYGYGYGTGTGTKSITYSVGWTSPTNWAAGNYVAEMVIATASTNFTQTSSTFTLSVVVVPPGGGGGGGGGGGAPPVPPGTTDVSGSISQTGIFVRQIIARSPDGNVQITIDKNTVGKTKDGKALSYVSVAKMTQPPVPPAQTAVIGLVYEFGPEGATFSPGVTLTFNYDPNLLPKGIREDSLLLAIWDKEANQWVTLEDCVLNTENNTITATVTHFSVYSIIAYTRPASFSISSLAISPAEVNAGESVTVSFLVSNSGDLSGTNKVTLKIGDSVAAIKDITLTGGTSETVTIVVSRDAGGEYQVNVGSLSGSFTVRNPPRPASFLTRDIIISPEDVPAGQSVNVSVLVTNTGEESGTYAATLFVDGEEVETREVSLSGGASQRVSFVTSRDKIGAYSVRIDDLSGSFTVTQELGRLNYSWVLMGSLCGVIIIGLIAWALLRRRMSY